MAEVPSTLILKPGDPAPEFDLPDGDGEPRRLDAIAGPSGTLVAFVCNHCPFVVHLARELGNLAREIAGRDIATVAINSNDVARYPADAPDKTRRAAHILVVDDEEHVRELAKEMLGELGHRVTCRPDGQSAVAYYREAWREIDLVVLDVVMPNLGGRETLARLREINPELRAILTSGYILFGDDSVGVMEGAFAFVAKPFEMAELARRIEEALEA